MPGQERAAIIMGQPKARRTKMKSTYGNGLHLTLADLQARILRHGMVTDVFLVTTRNRHRRELTERPHLDTRLRYAGAACGCGLMHGLTNHVAEARFRAAHRPSLGGGCARRPLSSAYVRRCASLGPSAWFAFLDTLPNMSERARDAHCASPPILRTPNKPEATAVMAGGAPGHLPLRTSDLYVPRGRSGGG